MSNTKQIINDKTKAALKGYVISSVNDATTQIEGLLPQIRGAVESDDFRAAFDNFRKVRQHMNELATVIEHSVSVQRVQVYDDAEKTESAGEYIDDRPMLKKSRLHY